MGRSLCLLKRVLKKVLKNTSNFPLISTFYMCGGHFIPVTDKFQQNPTSEATSLISYSNGKK